MELAKPWTPSGGSTGRLLEKYHEREGGLLVCRVNAAHKKGSRNRWCSLRIKNPPGDLEGEAYYYTAENRSDVRNLVARYPTEVIQVYDWGFSGFGRVVGKARLIERTWNPEDLSRVLIVDNPGEGTAYYPNEARDSATHDVFNEFDIEVEVLE